MSDAENGDDSDLKFYKHREWKPGADAAAPPQPKKVEGSTVIEKPASTSGSPWNAAGTWEEKSQKTWAVEAITKSVVGLVCDVNSGGQVKVSEVSITGDASINFIRGKKRFPFDFKVDLTIEGPDGMKCSVVIPEFASDEEAPYDMDFSWKGDDSGRTDEARAAVGATKKEIEAEKGLMHHVHTALAQWIADFQKL